MNAAASLDRCLCCSLHQGAVVAGNYAIIAYGAALAVYIWWIVESQGQTPVPAFILVALYFVTFVVSVVLVLSLSVQKKTTVLLSWIVTMGAFLLPECGLNMWVCIWILGTSTSKGLGFLIFYILRAVVNIICMICIHALYTWWKVEKSVSKQRIAQVWCGNHHHQHPYYLWNPPAGFHPAMLTYPGYEPQLLPSFKQQQQQQRRPEETYGRAPVPCRPPRKPKRPPVSAGHVVKHRIVGREDFDAGDPETVDPEQPEEPLPPVRPLLERPQFRLQNSRDPFGMGAYVDIVADEEDFDQPSKDSALGTEPTIMTQDGSGKASSGNNVVQRHHQHHAPHNPPRFAFGDWFAANPPQRPPLWRPFAAVPYNNLKALRAAHAQALHAAPLPPPPSNVPAPPGGADRGAAWRAPPSILPQHHAYFAPPIPPHHHHLGHVFSQGVIPLYGTASSSSLTAPSSRRRPRGGATFVSVPPNPIPPNSIYDYSDPNVEPAFANFIMRQKGGQGLGGYRPKTLRGATTDALRAEALQHVYVPEDPKSNLHTTQHRDTVGFMEENHYRSLDETRRQAAEQNFRFGNHHHGGNPRINSKEAAARGRLGDIKTITYFESPSNPRARPFNGRFYGPDVIEDWRTMM